MQKVRISTDVWMLILMVVMSCFLLYFNDARFSEQSVFNKQASTQVMIMWLLFLGVYMLPKYIAIARSPVVVTSQDHCTWIPMEPAVMMVPRNTKGKQPCPDIVVVQRKSLMALGFYAWANGKFGYELTWDIPGMAIRLGDTLVIASKTRKCYIGREQHQRLGLIYDTLKAYCDSKGYKCDDDTPIWVNWVPLDEVKVPDGYKEALMDFLDLNEMYGAKLGYKDSLLTEQWMNEESRIARTYGRGWRDALKPQVDDSEPARDNREPEQR